MSNWDIREGIYVIDLIHEVVLRVIMMQSIHIIDLIYGVVYRIVVMYKKKSKTIEVYTWVGFDPTRYLIDWFSK